MRRLVVALALALAGASCERRDSAATVVIADSGSDSDSGSDPGSGSGSPPASRSAPTPGSTARPAAITDAMLAHNDAVIGHIRELGAALAAAGTDCKQATAALVAATPALTAAIAAVHHDDLTDEAAGHWLDQRNAAALAPAGDPFLAIGEHCKRDPAFMTAIKAIGILGGPAD